MNQKTRKNIVSLIITLAILGGAAFIASKMASKKQSTVSDKTIKKERRKVSIDYFTEGSADNYIDIDGRLQAHDRVNITSKVQGVMKSGSRSIRAGSYFKKGELLFSLEDQEAAYNVKAQRSNMMTLITQMMPDLKFDYAESFGQWDAYLKAFDIDKDIRELPKPVSDQEKYFVSGKGIYNQYYAIKSLETRLKDYRIYSPFSGIITAVNAFPGVLISPGQNLASMINTSTFEITAPIELENLKYVKTGQKVDLKADGLDQVWSGRVSRIGTQIDASTQNLPLYISVSGKGLKDGMYLKGQLVANELSNIVALPKEIFLSPNTVFVVEDSTLVEREIVPVKREENLVLVRGISSDDKIVTGSLAGLFEGQKVEY